MNSDADISFPRPLSGVRVVSIALNLPGPACARRLADFGATVVKVEPPDALGGDPMRIYAPSYYEALHEGLDVRTLNLKNVDDRAAFDDLLATADVLLTAQREAALAPPWCGPRLRRRTCPSHGRSRRQPWRQVPD